jgi:hypothetical protein
VAAYLSHLDHPLKDVVEELRKLIRAVDAQIGEQITWNSLAFYYTGEMKLFDPKEYKRDIVVFNLHKKNFVLLVFSTGATVNDANGLLEGKFKDGRKIVRFCTMEEVEKRTIDLQKVISNWLTLVEK